MIKYKTKEKVSYRNEKVVSNYRIRKSLFSIPHLMYLLFSILREYFSIIFKANTNTVFSRNLEDGNFFFIFFNSNLKYYGKWAIFFSFFLFSITMLFEFSKRISDYYLKIIENSENRGSNENNFITFLINIIKFSLSVWLFWFLTRKIKSTEFKEYLFCAILNTIIYLVYNFWVSKRKIVDRLKDKNFLIHFDKTFLLLFSLVCDFNGNHTIVIYLFGVNYSNILRSSLNFLFTLY